MRRRWRVSCIGLSFVLLAVLALGSPVWADTSLLRVAPANAGGGAGLPVITRVVAPSGSPASTKADYFATGKDDHRTINQAVQSLPLEGGRIELLEGVYNLSGGIVLTSNVAVVGKGNGPDLLMSRNSNTSIIVNSDPLNGNKGLAVENIRIKGNKAGQSAGSGIHFRRVSDSVVSNVEVRDVKHTGVDILAGSHRNVIKNIRVFSSGDIGLVISESNDNQVSEVLAEDNGYGGVWVHRGENNKLSGIYALNNRLNGIEVEANNNTLTGVITAGNTHGGAYIVNASGNYIQGTAHNNAMTGFALNGSRGNTLRIWAVANGRHGVDLYNSSLNLMVDSLARNNGTSGAGFSGIHISDDGQQPSNYNMILFSYAWDDQKAKTQEFGVRLAGAADYTVIIGNYIEGNKLGALSAEVKHNITLNNTPSLP